MLRPQPGHSWQERLSQLSMGSGVCVFRWKLGSWAKGGENLFLSSGCTTATFTKLPTVLEPVLTKQPWTGVHHSDRTKWASPHTGVPSGLSFGYRGGATTWKELWGLFKGLLQSKIYILSILTDHWKKGNYLTMTFENIPYQRWWQEHTTLGFSLFIFKKWFLRVFLSEISL